MAAKTDAKFDDFVQKDGVIKELVTAEEKARESWHKKWDYTKDFHKVCLEVASEMGISKEEYGKMVERCAPKKHRKKKIAEAQPLSSDEIPKTSSGMIGWRSKRPELWLEKYGPFYISPRFTLNPPGQEEFKNTYIILG